MCLYLLYVLGAPPAARFVDARLAALRRRQLASVMCVCSFIVPPKASGMLFLVVSYTNCLAYTLNATSHDLVGGQVTTPPRPPLPLPSEATTPRSAPPPLSPAPRRLSRPRLELVRGLPAPTPHGRTPAMEDGATAATPLPSLSSSPVDGDVKWRVLRCTRLKNSRSSIATCRHTHSAVTKLPPRPQPLWAHTSISANVGRFDGSRCQHRTSSCFADGENV